MDGDLISRKALMSHIADQAREWGEEYDAGQILGDIEDMPAAYDADKVVERIAELDENRFTLPEVAKIVREGSGK